MISKLQVFERMCNHLRSMSAAKVRSLSIVMDTEIFRDLGIYGHDLFELFCWIEKEFNVRLNLNPGLYAPSESTFIGRIASSILKSEQKPYKSLKIRDLVALIRG